MANELVTSFNSSFFSVWDGVAYSAPKIVLAILVFVLGWYIASVVGKLIARGISTLRLDGALAETGLRDVLMKAGYNLNVGKFFGMLVKWFLIVVFTLVASDIVELSQVSDYLDTILAYIPNIIVAAIILMITALVAEFVEKLVVGAAKAADIHASGFLGVIARWVIWVLGFVTALQQLQVGEVFTQFFFTLLTGLVAAISIALGLAFGLGGKDHAARYLSKLDNDMKKN